jgi:tape measure domain-containing protein
MAFNEKLGEAIVSIRAKTDKLKSDLRGATAAVERSGNRMKRSMKTSSASMLASLGRVKGAIAAVAVAFAALGAAVVGPTAALERMQVAFTSALGDASKANALIDELKEFSAKTPFQLENIGQAARQLLAAGVAAKDITETLKVLGDIASGANIPLSDMASIFAKIENKGKAMTEELLQLSDRGIPILQILADKMGVSKDAIFELASQGKISAKVIGEAFEEMTSKGGMFADQMAKQSETLSGKWSTLKDNAGLLAAAIGDKLAPILKRTLDLMISLTQSATNFINNIGSGLKKLAQFRAGVADTKSRLPTGAVSASSNPALFQQLKDRMAGRLPQEVVTGGVEEEKVAEAVNKGVETGVEKVDPILRSRMRESFSSSLSDAIMGGEVGGAFESLADSFARTLSDRLADTVTTGLFGEAGGGGGGFLGGIIGNLFSGGQDGAPAGNQIGPTQPSSGGFFSGLFGAKALGGNVSSNKPYLVGERGPELFVPQTRGNVMANGSGSGGTTVVMNNNFAGVSAVNRQELQSALASQKVQILESVRRGARNGGSFSRDLRGE